MTEKAPHYDSLILGAGIIGVCAALHLQARGQRVVLIDRGPVGGETSHGNAGLIERSSVIPYAMPRDLLSLLAYASNRSLAVRYQSLYVLKHLPWLARYWWHSSQSELARIAGELLPLIELSVDEHLALSTPAGAEHLLRRTGWIEIYHSPRAFQTAIAATKTTAFSQLAFDILTPNQLRDQEPALHSLAGAIHWRDPVTTSNPGAVTKAYARLFEERGGRLAQAQAQALAQDEQGWRLATAEGSITARNAVIALGPWSGELAQKFGYHFPLAFKRGYHQHFRVLDGHPLTHPVCDSASGFVLSPMDDGIRLTTGIELAALDAPSNLAQLRQAATLAKKFFSLGPPVETLPWRGVRPCLPDMKPIIGEAPRHKGLWFSFGHAHHGFTLGPVSGRLLAEMMVGAPHCADPRPFSPHRFG